MAGIKLRIPRFLGLSQAFSRGLGRLEPPKGLGMPRIVAVTPHILTPGTVPTARFNAILAPAGRDGKVSTYSGAPWVDRMLEWLPAFIDRIWQRHALDKLPAELAIPGADLQDVARLRVDLVAEKFSEVFAGLQVLADRYPTRSAWDVPAFVAGVRLLRDHVTRTFGRGMEVIVQLPNGRGFALRADNMDSFLEWAFSPLTPVTQPPPHLAAYLRSYIKVRSRQPLDGLGNGLQELASMQDTGPSDGADSAHLTQSIAAYGRYNNPEASDSALSPEQVREREAQWEAAFTAQVMQLFPAGIPFVHGGHMKVVPNMGGWFWGVGSFERESGGLQGRIYLSVGRGETTIDGATFSNAAWLYAMLTRLSIRAGDNGHSFGFKLISSPSGLKRGDSAVIYFNSPDQEYLYRNVLLPLSQQGLLKGNTPLFTAQLLDPDGKPLTGMAFGQSPNNHNESFGTRRARVIDGVSHSTNADRAKGKKFSFDALVCAVANAFQEAGVDPEFPAFDAGGREVFAFIASHATMSPSETAAAQTRWHAGVRAETPRNKDILAGNRGNALAPERYADHLIFGPGASLSDYMLGAVIDRRTGAIVSFGFTPKALSSDPALARVLITMERGDGRDYHVRDIQASNDGKAGPDLIRALNEELAGSVVAPKVDRDAGIY